MVSLHEYFRKILNKVPYGILTARLTSCETLFVNIASQRSAQNIYVLEIQRPSTRVVLQLFILSSNCFFCDILKVETLSFC